MVFNSGRWTLNAEEGWLWLPDQRCVNVAPAAVASNGEPMPLPPLLPAIKVRTIKHPLGTQFAYPYGQEAGRGFLAGVQVPMPTWTAPISAYALPDPETTTTLCGYRGITVDLDRQGTRRSRTLLRSGADEPGLAKPDPEIFRAALRLSPTTPHCGVRFLLMHANQCGTS